MEDIYSDISLVIDCFYNILETNIHKDTISISNINLTFLENFDEIFMNMLQCQSILLMMSESPNRYLFNLEDVWLIVDIKSNNDSLMTDFSLYVYRSNLNDILECFLK